MTLSQHMKTWFCIIGMGLMTGFSGCEEESQSSLPHNSSGKPQVYVVNYPLFYFTQRIADDFIEVIFPAPADTDPAFWQPDRKAIQAFQQADLIILNGATYAKWVAHATLPATKIINTSLSFQDRWIALDQDVTHAHGPGGRHAHGDIAFTTWLDFDQARRQAEAIKVALAELLPDRAEQIQTNFDTLAADLTQLDEQMTTIAKKIKNQPLMASHPVYQYMSRRYQLNLKAVHWEPDTVLTDNNLNDLQQLLQDHQAGWIIWEDEPAPDNVNKLAAMGIKCVVFQPCFNHPLAGDFLTVMNDNLQNLTLIDGKD